MNETRQMQTPSATSGVKMLQAMVGIGVICALLIVLSYEGTRPRIEQLKAEALEKAIFNVIPGISKTKTFQLNQAGKFTEDIDKKLPQPLVYAGYDNDNRLMGVAIEGSGQGYADIIRILYGYNPETQKVVGFYVLESKETPGLGDKIEKDSVFHANFHALDVALTDDGNILRNQVVTVKHGAKKNAWEVDGITGATISSRAIGAIMSTSTNEMIPLLYKNKSVFTMPDEPANE